MWSLTAIETLAWIDEIREAFSPSPYAYSAITIWTKHLKSTVALLPHAPYDA